MSDEHEFGLVMPFVVVASKGGPYDDEAYVAGYEAGNIDLLLERKDDAKLLHGFPAHTANVPQIDLLAMQHGYTMIAEPSENAPEWTFLSFEPMTEPR